MRQAAEQGHARAKLELARMYEGGYGVEQDYSEAARWYRQAAEQDDAATRVELLRDRGYGFDQSDPEAERRYRLSEAHFGLAHMIEDGRGLVQDDSDAARHYRSAAECGHNEAQIELARLYEEGRGLPQDEVEATRWIRKAAEQDDFNAQLKLGRRYACGRGALKDNVLAHMWYSIAKHSAQELGPSLGALEDEQKADEQRSDLERNMTSADVCRANEMARIGMPRRWDSVPESRHYDAETVLQRRYAAQQGDPDAQFNLGLRYAAGLGVLQDPVLAYMWFERAHKNGNPDASERQAALARTMNAADPKSAREAARALGMAANHQPERRGPCKDDATAVGSVWAAAEAGDIQAQATLGRMYAEGQGVHKNSELAHMWLNIGAANGNEAAAELRNALERDMTRSEIGRATEIARHHTTSDYEECGPLEIPWRARFRPRY